MSALDAVLSSEKFVTAPQMSAFLRYVVEQAAAGNRQRIKAYTVAVEALGKPDSFDPQNDPVVRVLAGRLRSSLSAYYESHTDQDVIIEMKPGSYVPSFIVRQEDGESASVEVDQEDEEDDLCLTAANSVIFEDHMEVSGDESEPVRSQGDAHEAVASDDEAKHDQPPTDEQHGYLSRLRKPLSGRRNTGIRQFIGRHPVASAAAVTLLAFLVGLAIPLNERVSVPALGAASILPLSDRIQRPDQLHQRPRPDSISLFMQDVIPADSMLNQINTIMSTVFADAADFQVYRSRQGQQGQYYWPEDYLVSLYLLPMPEQTRISVQLLDAQTGRISHSQVLQFNADAEPELTAEDVRSVTDLARYLISDDGPLQQDYHSKLDG